MATQYTSILKLALPVQGELSGTWGDVVNDNITSMVEEAIAGRKVINTWSSNSHTLTSADGTTSESRAAILTLTDTGSSLTGAGTVICPAASKVYIVENGTGQTITVKTSSGTGIAVPNGKNMVVFCDGTNVEEGITNINSLTLNGDGATVSSIKDEDNMASNSATALATQQSIKAYVDSQVATADTLAEVLANGNTTGGTSLVVSSGDDVTFTGASANVVFDSSDSALEFADNAKVIFGAGSDLQIFHDGSNSHITEGGTGDLIIRGANVEIQTGGGNKYFQGASNIAKLFHTNNEKLATTSTGIDVTGKVVSDGLDTSEDLIIRHSTTDHLQSILGTDSGGFAIEDNNAFIVWHQDIANVGTDTGLTERFRIDVSGNLGLGTSGNPAFTTGSGLEIQRAGAATLRLEDTGSSGKPFEIYSDDGEGYVVNGIGSGMPMIFKTVNAERARIDTSGNVGIGTTSIGSSTKLQVAGRGLFTDGLPDPADGSPAGVAIGYNTTSGYGFIQAIQTGVANKDLYLQPSGSNNVIIANAGGNVGIGNSSPSSFSGDGDNLVVGTTSGNNGISIISATDGSGNLYFGDTATTGGGSRRGQLVYDHASDAMSFATAVSERMRIDSSGNLLVGKTVNNTFNEGFVAKAAGGANITSAGDIALELNRRTSDGTLINFRKDNTAVGSIASVGGADIKVVFSSDGDQYITGNSASNYLTFSSANAERMRLDSSGVLLVGKTSSNAIGTAGIEIDGTNDRIMATRDGNEPLLINRLSSDGTLVDFKKDGSTVGTIGTNGGDLYVGTGDTNILFADGSDALVPANTGGATRDAAINLGTSGAQFKDLHLSNAANIGKEVSFTNSANSSGFDIGLLGGSSDGTAFIFQRANDSLNFGTNDTERVRIDSSGNVGIGTSSPSTTLDVSGVTTITTANNSAQLILKSTDADSAVGPRMDLIRDSASPADGDLAGQIRFLGDNDAGEQVSYGFIRAKLQDVSDGSEDGQFDITLKKDGTDRSRIRIQDTETVINEDSVDVNFRVESDGTSHMLFVDAGNDRVGVGTSSPTVSLEVSSGTIHDQLRVHRDINGDNTTMGAIALSGDDSGGNVTDYARIKALSESDNAGSEDGGIIFETMLNATISEVARLDSGGNFLVAKTATSLGTVGIALKSNGAIFATVDDERPLILNRETAVGTIAEFRKDNGIVGSISVSASATTYNTSSDARLKRNITDADEAGSLIDAIQVRKFDWIEDGSHQRYGMVAQELETVVPDAVSTGETEEDMMGVDYSKLVPMMMKEIQSLRARVAQLEGEN